MEKCNHLLGGDDEDGGWTCGLICFSLLPFQQLPDTAGILCVYIRYTLADNIPFIYKMCIVNDGRVHTMYSIPLR